MCGIVGYVGSRPAAPILLEALAHLEYRGYDSAGIAVGNSEGALSIRKAPGKLAWLADSLKKTPTNGVFGVGHTRWATHGSPNNVNAHPLTDCADDIVIVHNGIVENYLEIKAELLAAGHFFESETDSEVIAHLIESFMNSETTFEQAIRLTAQRIRGAQAIVAMRAKEPGRLVSFRLGNAGGITVGYGHGEMFLASDLPALLNHTSEVAFLSPGEFVVVDCDQAYFSSIEGKAIEKSPQAAPYDALSIAKDGYRHYMLKEIMEQPSTTHRALSGRVSFDPADVLLPNFPFTDEEVRRIDRIILTGMGTSLHACMVARYYMEHIAGIASEVENSSEFRYRNPILNANTLLISVTQSGQTADTLAAMEEAAKHHVRQITICNIAGSQAARMADGAVFIEAGLEIGVASTKCLTGSMVTLYLLATHLAKARGQLSKQKLELLLNDLAAVPRLIGQVLGNETQFAKLAQRYANYYNFLYLGRGINMPVAMEGALKLKEVSYIHAEGYSAGEMKHGPIALVDKDMPVVAIAPNDHLYDKMYGNIQEVKARRGQIIALATEGHHELSESADALIEVPEVPYLISPIINVVPLQLLAYQIAVHRGCDVDQPRNLAKTVTVE